MNLENVLNQQIADFNVLYTKLHRFHWYVKGPQFLRFMKNLKNSIMRRRTI